MRGLGIALAAVAGMIATPALASDWWMVHIYGHRPEQNILYLDVASLKIRGNVRDIWEATYHEAILSKYGNARVVKALYSWNCVDRTFAGKFIVSYDDANNVVQSATMDGTPQPVVPDTQGEHELELVCDLSNFGKKTLMHLGQNETIDSNGHSVIAKLNGTDAQ